MMKSQVNHAHLEVSEVMGVPLKSSISGWWLSPTPLKNDGVKVSWYDEIPNIWKNNPAMFQTTNQTLIGCSLKKNPANPHFGIQRFWTIRTGSL